MLKMKDWPSDKSFDEVYPDEYVTFRSVCKRISPGYTDRTVAEGPNNLASYFPTRDIPPDLGPKTYIAHGGEQEDGEAIGGHTNIHLDMSDAFNVIVDLESEPQWKPGSPAPAAANGAETSAPLGAVWHIWHLEDQAKVPPPPPLPTHPPPPPPPLLPAAVRPGFRGRMRGHS